MNMIAKQMALCAIGLCLCQTSSNVSAAPRTALVVGISDYPADGALSDLRNPVNDAKLIAGTLKQAGFTVMLVTDATKGQIKGRLDEFVDTIQPGGDAVVYFAGHGMQYAGVNYLLASNAKLMRKYDLGEESLEADTLLQALAEKKPGAALVFLDCCRTPPNSSWLASDKRSGIQPGLVAMQNTDLLIHYAAAPGMPALDGKGANSPYATALAKYLLDGKELAETLRDVANEVLKNTDREQRPFQTGSLLRPFSFAKANAVVSSQVQTPQSVPQSSATVPVQSPTVNTPIITPQAPPAPTLDIDSLFANGPYSTSSKTHKTAIVMRVQALLKESGLYDQTPDGAPGPNTQAALRRWQEQHGKVTGRLDSQTLEKMGLDNIPQRIQPRPSAPSSTPPSSTPPSSKGSNREITVDEFMRRAKALEGK